LLPRKKPSMPLELAAVTFDGAFTAERELNNLRVSRLDAWVGEVAVLEHHDGGMYSTRAISPDYGGNGYTEPGFRGLPGLLLAAAVGAIPRLGTSQSTGPFGVVADFVRALLPADSSALMLIAEGPAADEFVSAVAPRGCQVGRRELSDEQVRQLRLAASRR
jgi:uncharacterized membrane protein